MSDNKSDTVDPQAPKSKEPYNPLEAIKENLTVTEEDKKTDDEMSRPPDDRSPLT